jgi:flavin-dependent dehydrogenase
MVVKVDVLVVGGGFAGIAAACAAAEAGKRVLLAERRTYLGAECTATLRPWRTSARAEGLAALLGSEVSEYAVPDRLKLALEDRLLAAGVELLYCARPVGVERDGTFRVSLATKGGVVYVDAAAVVDATEQAAVGRRLGAATARSGEGPLRVWRTLELTGVDLEALGGAATLDVPAEIAPVPCRIHPGHSALEVGHLLVEHALDVPAPAGPLWQQAAEVGARFATMGLARWLKEHHPAFAGARVTATAPELAVPPLWRVEPAAPGLFVAGGCSGSLEDGQAVSVAENLADLVRLGREAGESAAAAAAAVASAAAEATVPAEAALSAPAAWPLVKRTVDVLVVGGGTSGAPAAVAAARAGASTLVVEMNPGLGGTGTVGGVDSYWFGRKGGWNAEVSRRVAEQHAWMGWTGGKWNVEGKMIALLSLAKEAGVEVLLGALLVEVRTTADGRVTGALVATPEALVEIEAAVTVDATGDGDVAVRAGAEHAYGSDREGVTMWYSMIPLLRPGVYKNNFTSTVNVGDPLDYTRAILSARRRLTGGHDHGTYVAPRESRHVIGGVRISLTDILTMRRWPDVVNIHFSNHDVKGHNTSDWLRMGLIPPNLEVELPYRALIPLNVGGVIVTGKAFSATHDSLPPIRMQADLENLGFVAGTAAAMAAARGVEPRDLPVRDLQTALVSADILPADVPDRSLPEAAAPTDAEMRGWVEALNDADLLFQYGEMEMHEVRREPIPIVQVCTAGPAIIPWLLEALAQPERRLMAARALAWYGDRAATPVLLAEISRHLDGVDEVPRRTAAIRYTQASPDHGAMPELAYLLHTLAWVRDELAIPVLMQVAGKLNPTYERFTEHHSGVFHYVDAICDVAERLGHPGCLPALRRLREYPLFQDRVSTAMVQPDYFEERLAYLESTIGRAMARCGDPAGLQILIGYLQDSRRMLVIHAHRELQRISGLDLPAASAAWQAWAAGLAVLKPCPWISERE